MLAAILVSVKCRSRLVARLREAATHGCTARSRHYTRAVLTRPVRSLLAGVALLHFALLLAGSLARFHHVHQRTFDLALYTRIAWGLAHGDLLSPVSGSHVLGTHIAPVLFPLGLLGRLLGVVPVLLVAQAGCIALTLFPLARIAARRLGKPGVTLAIAAFVLYPNLFHVGTYEFHPGTLALLPMAWSYDALDRARFRSFAWALAAVVACREDLALFALLIALVYFSMHRDRRALWLAGSALLYLVISLSVITMHAPAQSSGAQHFGFWGGSPFGIARTLFEDPARVWAHFTTRERLLYLPRVLAPLSFFSLRAPRLLLPALPYLALNLASTFPTATAQYSHYLTAALPALLVSGLVGVTDTRAKFVRFMWFATLVISHHALGGSPLSRDFDRAAYFPDQATHAARQVLAQVPREGSVEAPDALLPHLAERELVRRVSVAPDSDYVVLDISHRTRYARSEQLLRTLEEPRVRALFARADYALRLYTPPYALFVRGPSRESELTRTCFGSAPSSARAIALSSCLELAAASLSGRELTLYLRARGACPSDLALRFGPDPMPGRVELLCGGMLSPAVLRAGDVVVSRYGLSERGVDELRSRGLWVGALRANGAPVEAHDPAAIEAMLERGSQ
jgi:uncharacterized membrane protein